MAKLANVTCLHEDFGKLIDSLRADVVFLDPPWGGKCVDTASKDSVELTLGGLALDEICKRLQVRYVLFKLPPAYNFTKLQADLIDFHVTINSAFRKMVLVIVDLKKKKETEVVKEDETDVVKDSETEVVVKDSNPSGT